MPSWNIHAAHVERLLKEATPTELGVSDVNIFLFGNYVPDIYVGYLVPNITHKIDYLATHMARPHPIPQPNAGEFWHAYTRRDPSDINLGVWAHLVADHLYNQATREFLHAQGMEVDSTTRERKQADFADFGHTLDISMLVEPTPELLEAAYNFKHYTILEADVRAACEVANEFVRDTQVHHIQGVPEYRLLSEEFFKKTFERVHATILRGLMNPKDVVTD